MWTATGGTAESSQLLSFSKSGSPVLNPLVPQIDTDGGMPRVQTQGQLKNPAGRVYDIGASGRIPAGEVAGAVGRFAVRSAGALLVGVALYDLAKELLIIAGRNPDGSLKLQKELPGTCPIGVCYEWQALSYVNGGTAPWFPSIEGACNYSMGKPFNGKPITSVSVTGPNSCEYFITNVYGFQSSQGSYARPRRTLESTPPTLVDVPLQEFLDAVAAKSGWPSGSAISKVLAHPDAALDTKIEPGPLTITGPATSLGTTTTTQNTTNNTTKTETATYNHTYQGNKVNTTTTTTSTTTNNVDNSVIDQSTTTTNPPVQQDPLDKPDPITCGLPDTPICAVKVNEDGTPTEISEDTAIEKVEALTSAQEQGLERMGGDSDSSGFFGSWDVFWAAPAVVACVPMPLPSFQGVPMGEIDACPVVDGMRTVMGYLWALGGLFLCLGFVRQAVQLG
jgi:hypothetical protein